MFNIILKQIFHFITFPTISFLYDSDDNLSERMEGSHYGLERNQSHHSPPTKNMPRALLWAINIKFVSLQSALFVFKQSLSVLVVAVGG